MLVVDERRAARDFLLAPSQFDNRPIKGALPFGGGSVVKAHKVSSPYLRPPRPGNPKAFALPEKAPFLRHGEPLRFVFRDALFPRPRRARLDAALASSSPGRSPLLRLSSTTRGFSRWVARTPILNPPRDLIAMRRALDGKYEETIKPIDQILKDIERDFDMTSQRRSIIGSSTQIP